MRTLPATFLLLLCAIPALANSYTAGESGYLHYQAGYLTQYWAPRIPGLTHPGGDPHMFPTTFTNASRAVMCTPVCGVGNDFSISLAMSGFTLQIYPYQGDPMVGTLSLLAQPIILRADSGIAIAKFTLTGNLVACSDSTCNHELFGLDVNLHGYATLTYSLVSGQLKVSSVSYALPEPSGLVLLGTGLISMMARVRNRVGRNKQASAPITESA
jgi:hypothetical protein